MGKLMGKFNGTLKDPNNAFVIRLMTRRNAAWFAWPRGWEMTKIEVRFVIRKPFRIAA